MNYMDLSDDQTGNGVKYVTKKFRDYYVLLGLYMEIVARIDERQNALKV
jgi:hypothetical protein